MGDKLKSRQGIIYKATNVHKSCRWIPLNLFRGGKRLIPPFY